MGPEDESAGWAMVTRPKRGEEFFALSGTDRRYCKHENMLGFCYTQLYDVEQEVNGLLHLWAEI